MGELLTRLMQTMYEQDMAVNILNSVLHLESGRRWGVKNPGKCGEDYTPFRNIIADIYFNNKELIRSQEIDDVKRWMYSLVIPRQVELIDSKKVDLKLHRPLTRSVRDTLDMVKSGEANYLKERLEVEEHWQLWVAMLY